MESTQLPSIPPPAGIEIKDAAWVRIPTSYSAADLSFVLQDSELLLRLNPYYYFSRFVKSGSDAIDVEFENQSNQQHVSVKITIVPGPDKGVTLQYQSGIKHQTLFTIEPAESGSCLVITDDYSGTSESERKQREAEIDRSISAWGEALRIYLQCLQRYARLPGWRWYMRHIWIPMKPSGRRIVWLLSLITLVEFFFFCFVVLIWWVEKHK